MNKTVIFVSVALMIFCLALNVSGSDPAPQKPVISWFRINNGAVSASDRSVTLNNSVQGDISLYRASEKIDLSGLQWTTYNGYPTRAPLYQENVLVGYQTVASSSAPAFTLSEGNGQKTIYFQVKNQQGQASDVINSGIILNVPAAAYRGSKAGALPVSAASHPEGEVSGLSVKERQAENQVVTIGPGVAIDPYGRQISVCEQLSFASETRLPRVDAGMRYSYQIKNSGTPPFTYAIVKGALPAHLVLDPKTGIISGLLAHPKKIKSAGMMPGKMMVEEEVKDSAFTVRVMDSCPTGRLSTDKEFTIPASHLRHIRTSK